MTSTCSSARQSLCDFPGYVTRSLLKLSALCGHSDCPGTTMLGAQRPHGEVPVTSPCDIHEESVTPGQSQTVQAPPYLAPASRWQPHEILKARTTQPIPPQIPDPTGIERERNGGCCSVIKFQVDFLHGNRWPQSLSLSPSLGPPCPRYVSILNTYLRL
jgi:hypothetical protein